MVTRCYIVQSDITIVVPWQLLTGSKHDYLFCYCPIVGISFEVLRIMEPEKVFYFQNLPIKNINFSNCPTNCICCICIIKQWSHKWCSLERVPQRVSFVGFFFKDLHYLYYTLDERSEMSIIWKFFDVEPSNIKF